MSHEAYKRNNIIKGENQTKAKPNRFELGKKRNRKERERNMR